MASTGLRYTLRSLILCTLLGACGGGGDDTSPVAIAPAPTPTPTPSPPPSPIPLPTPTLRAYASSVVAAAFYFGDDYLALQFASGFGSRDGFYYPGFRDALLPSGWSNDPNRPATSDLANNFKSVEGYDQLTGHYISMYAPREAQVITPLTTQLIYLDQNKIKNQLGIVGTNFGFKASDPNLLTYDAISDLQSPLSGRRDDAVKMLGFHIKITALAVVLGYINEGQNPHIGPTQNYTGVGAHLLSRLPNRYIINEDDLTSRFLDRHSFGLELRSDVLKAASYLVIKYIDTINENLSASNVPQFTNGVYGFLAMRIERLFRGNSSDAIAEARSVTSDVILSYIEKYNYKKSIPNNGRIFPSVNYYAVNQGQSLNLLNVYAPAQNYNHFQYIPTFDDARIGTSTIGQPTRDWQAQLVSVSVPPENINDLRVELKTDGTVTITPLTGIQQVSYFTYQATSYDGEVQSGLAYVTVNP